MQSKLKVLLLSFIYCIFFTKYSCITAQPTSTLSPTQCSTNGTDYYNTTGVGNYYQNVKNYFYYQSTGTQIEFLKYTPLNYNASNTAKKYPLLIYFHGAPPSSGPADVCWIRHQGPWISLMDGTQISTAGLINKEFFVIAPHYPMTPAQIDELINMAVYNDNIDLTRIYFMSVSGGSSPAVNYLTYSDCNSARVAGITEFCGWSTANSTVCTSLVKNHVGYWNFMVYVNNGQGFPAEWGEGTDTRKTTATEINSCSSPSAYPKAVITRRSPDPALGNHYNMVYFDYLRGVAVPFADESIDGLTDNYPSSSTIDIYNWMYNISKNITVNSANYGSSPRPFSTNSVIDGYNNITFNDIASFQATAKARASISIIPGTSTSVTVVPNSSFSIEGCNATFITGSQSRLGDNTEESLTEAVDRLVKFNPASGWVSLNLNNTLKSWIGLYSILGRPIKTYSLEAGDSKFNVDDLPSGLYLIKVTQESISKSEKLIINNN
jgi:hypothetical protein